MIKSFSSKLLVKFSFLCLGIILGSICTNFALGFQIETLYKNNESLRVTVSEQQTQIENLEKKINESKNWLIVQQVEIAILLPEKEYPSKETIVLSIENHVQKLLSSLLGQKVKELDPRLIENIINGRQVKIVSTTFKLQVKSMVISEKVKVLIQVIEMKTINSDIVL